MEILVELIANIVDAISLIFLGDIILGKNYRLNKNITILLVLAAHLSFIPIQKYIPIGAILTICSFSLMLAISYLYYGKFIKHFLLAACITIVGFITEGILYAGMQVIGEITENGYVVGLMLSKALTLVFISLIRTIVKKPTVFRDRRISIFIFVCQLISVIVLFLLADFVINATSDNYGATVGISILILLLNLCVYYMFDSISDAAKANEERIRAYSNLEKTEQQYNMITDKYRTVRSYIHDTNKHFTSIRRFLCEEKNSEAIEYIDSVIELENAKNDFVNSGNVIVDALVNELKNKCEKANVECNIDIAINNNDIRVEAPDFAVIIGNLLDNAYNAVKKVTDSNNKIIEVKIFNSEGKIAIHVSNTHENTDFTKSYGIQNIETTVKKYGGIYYTEQKDGKYYASVFISNIYPNN